MQQYAAPSIPTHHLLQCSGIWKAPHCPLLLAVRQCVDGAPLPTAPCNAATYVSISILPRCGGRWAWGLVDYTSALQRAVGSGTPSVCCCSASGSGQLGSSCTVWCCCRKWAVGILRHTATLQGVGGSGTPSMYPRTAPF